MSSIPNTSPHITILDGGMSRDLIRLQAPFKQPEWSALALIEAPHLVQRVHEDFMRSGADVITTNSYALVPFHIGAERFWSEGRELIRRAGWVAVHAVEKCQQDQALEGQNEKRKKPSIAGCLPPIFGSYEPQLFDGGNAQKYLLVLVEGLQEHVDLWLGETLSLIAEGEAVRMAVEKTRKPFWVSFTLDDASGAEEREPRLRGGESVEDAASWAVKSGVESLLFNCCRPEVISGAIYAARKVFVRLGHEIPLGAYANAFEPTSSKGGANEEISPLRKDLDARRYVEYARHWIEDGATIVGGCCGIGHEYIAKLAEMVTTDRNATAAEK